LRFVDAGECGDVAVQADEEKARQVLINLLSNAIKFTPSQGRVTVSTRPGRDEVELFVSDTGMGIPASELEHLFQRFFRTDLAMTSAIPGTGLGLVIARAIVEGHGGRIEVASEVGAGTTFCVSLPGA
jgi:signal transduction histidine kinase